MGIASSSARDDASQGCWLATSEDAAAKVSSKYFFHQQQKHFNPTAADETVQDKFLAFCEKITGVKFPLGD